MPKALHRACLVSLKTSPSFSLAVKTASALPCHVPFRWRALQASLIMLAFALRASICASVLCLFGGRPPSGLHSWCACWSRAASSLLPGAGSLWTAALRPHRSTPGKRKRSATAPGSTVQCWSSCVLERILSLPLLPSESCRRSPHACYSPPSYQKM